MNLYSKTFQLKDYWDQSTISYVDRALFYMIWRAMQFFRRKQSTVYARPVHPVTKTRRVWGNTGHRGVTMIISVLTHHSRSDRVVETRCLFDQLLLQWKYGTSNSSTPCNRFETHSQKRQTMMPHHDVAVRQTAIAVRSVQESSFRSD